MHVRITYMREESEVRVKQIMVFASAYCYRKSRRWPPDLTSSFGGTIAFNITHAFTRNALRSDLNSSRRKKFKISTLLAIEPWTAECERVTLSLRQNRGYISPNVSIVFLVKCVEVPSRFQKSYGVGHDFFSLNFPSTKTTKRVSIIIFGTYCAWL